MQRFFVVPESIRGDKIHVIEENLVHQISRVLRMETGALCIFLDNSGVEYEAKLVDRDKRSVLFEIVKRRKSLTETSTEIVLFQALPKKLETFELILQKGTELGVTRFVPIVSDFCNRRELSKTDRLIRIITEAAEQSERGFRPTLSPIIAFKPALEQNRDEAILFHSRDTQNSLVSFLNPLDLQNKQHKKFAIFIGPEGGFSSTEIEFADSLKIPILTMGPRILRTETAAIVACGTLIQLLSRSC